ncbi:MAG: ThuA domain-containing protein [Planctomycetota bacterium]|nr:ThuA domain-containing protein [Planctomycetota bacterium]
MRQAWLTVLALALAAASVSVRAEEEVDPYDQSKIPIEVDATDPNAIKIVMIAGPISHGPGDHEHMAGYVLLSHMLTQTNPKVFPVFVKDGWPKNERIFEGAKVIACYSDGRGGHPLVQENGRRLDVLQKYIDQGVGFVCLHYAVDYNPKPNEGERVQKWLGGYYDVRISINPFWVADYKELPDHPICRGVKPFKQNDEWYYNMNFLPDAKGLTRILQAVPPDGTRGTADAKKYPGRAETTAWAYERPDGGRSFGFTGGHSHKFWANDDYRRLVTNAFLWAAKVEIPPAGAKVDLDPKDLKSNLDFKGMDVGSQVKMRNEVKALRARAAELEKENAELKAKAK